MEESNQGLAAAIQSIWLHTPNTWNIWQVKGHQDDTPSQQLDRWASLKLSDGQSLGLCELMAVR